MKPFDRTVMDELKDAGFQVIAIGKITDIFDGEGITESMRTESNMDGMDKLLESIRLIYRSQLLNLVDFDSCTAIIETRLVTGRHWKNLMPACPKYWKP